MAKTKKPFNYKRLIKSAVFATWYARAAVGVLLLSTCGWAIYTAFLHMDNADQLVNVFLFDNPATFQGAIFPTAHTFLIKWPLFLLVHLCGSSQLAFMCFTVGVTLATVGLFAYILWRIERRPLIFGTLCLALASVLLLVPPQPVAGALLPVNMAMLTTRNLEYILYIASLALLARRPPLKSKPFCVAVASLLLLFASDNLFLYFSAGGAFLAGCGYAVFKRWDDVKLATHWLIAGLLAGGGALGLLWIANHFAVIHLGSDPGSGPYGLVHSGKDAAIGSVYAVLGVLTNFGANPAFEATVIKNIPAQAAAHTLSLAGLAYLINMLVVAGGLYTVFQLARAACLPKKYKKIKPAPKLQLSVMLVCTTAAALGIFILSNHYYPVDARYLGISLFTLFICAATYASYKKWQPHKVVAVGAVLCIGIIAGSVGAAGMYAKDARAIEPTAARNALVASALANHPVNVLAADYWRALPIAAHMPKSNLVTMPLAGCTNPRDILTSRAWQPNLHSHSFAYLATLNDHYQGAPNCTLEQIISYFGQPNASALIAGTPTNPQELLLFYDRGTGQSQTDLQNDAHKIASPIAVDQVLGACDGPTIMNIVAHQDDDLLFMSPDLLQDVRAGHCIRTIYVTAGDAGNGLFYWLKREQGSEAAYSQMLGTNPIWTQRVVQVADHQFVTIASPKDNNKVALIFMHLPDGSPSGKGYSASHYESLQKLMAQKIKVIHSVTNDSSYSPDQLTDSLLSLMHTYKPNTIRTQADIDGEQYRDHSDHHTVGQFATLAYNKYKETAAANLISYIGYPIHEREENVTGDDLANKEAAFLRYAAFDSSVCQSAEECDQTVTYNAYLRRQYNDAPAP